MSYYILIRGPLGSGKTSVSERLAKVIHAEHISIDAILDEHGLEEWEEGYISQKSFLQANEFAADGAKRFLTRGIPVVFDGNFYWKSQIEDLVHRLSYRHFIFSLKAPLSICVERDSKRDSPHGSQAAKEVHDKSTEFEYGFAIDATNPLDKVVREIRSHLRLNTNI